VVSKMFDDFDFKNVFFLNKRKAYIPMEFDKKGVETLLLVATNQEDKLSNGKFSIIQEDEQGNIIGGSTFILNPLKR
jgi:hypothetical protein